MGNDNHVNMDDEYFKRATKRAVRCGANSTFDAIVFLEKEIERYRNTIEKMKTIPNAARIAAGFEPVAQLEAVQGNTVNEIIKALANNGYNTITINCYRDTESEE